MQEIPLHEEFSVTDLKTITRHPDTGSSKKESEKQASRKQAQASNYLKRDEFRHNSTSTGTLSGGGFFFSVVVVFFFKKNCADSLTHSQVIEDDGARSMLSVQKERNVQNHFKMQISRWLLTESLPSN